MTVIVGGGGVMLYSNKESSLNSTPSWWFEPGGVDLIVKQWVCLNDEDPGCDWAQKFIRTLCKEFIIHRFLKDWKPFAVKGVAHWLLSGLNAFPCFTFQTWKLRPSFTLSMVSSGHLRNCWRLFVSLIFHWRVKNTDWGLWKLQVSRSEALELGACLVCTSDSEHAQSAQIKWCRLKYVIKYPHFRNLVLFGSSCVRSWCQEGCPINETMVWSISDASVPSHHLSLYSSVLFPH